MILFFYLMAASCNQSLLLSSLAVEKQKRILLAKGGKNLWLYLFTFTAKYMEFKTVLRISLQYTSVISPREGEIYFLSLHVALEIKLFQDSGRLSLTPEGMFCIHGVFPDQTSLLWANRAGPCLVEMLVECRTC